VDAITLVIANRNYSSWSLRPWLALKHAGLPFDEVIVALDRPETRAEILVHSPSGRVPALRHGSVRVWDSLAICEYVAELAPNANLWPEDRAVRAVARAVSAEMHSGFAALRTQMTMNIRRRIEGVVPNAETRADIARILEIWNDCRSRFGKGGPFLFGGFTIADAMFAPVVTRFRTYGVDTGAVATAYMDATFADPAMSAWVTMSREEKLIIPKYEQPST
jgi:glutathione S-transferase